jgi:sigma-B regulation protein RsbU (phosphoserine phosphatase)
MVGDVSDKGVASALMMAVCKTLIKSRAIDDSSPGSIITRVNEEISSDNPSSMFITLFIAILDIETGELTVTNAGHNPPYIKRADGSLERLDKIHGPAIGAIEGIEYQEDTCFLKPDDLVLLFTDGVTDATSEEEKMYEEPRIVDFLNRPEINNSKVCVGGLLDEIMAFQGEHDQADDITILAVDFIKAQEGIAKEVLDLRIPNKLEEIASVQDQFEAYAEKVELDFGVTMKVNLVLDELLNNIISYAYHDKQVHEIKVLFERFESKLKLRIEDDGKEFNPLLMAPPDTEATMEDRKIGGLGIHLVKNVMDEVYYQRINNKNIMTMVKFI